jgi:hypothetical protein
MALQSITDTSASTDTTTYTALACDAPDSSITTGHNACRVMASCNASSGTATVRAVLKDASRVYRAYTLTLTPTTVRTGPDGSTGDYVAEVTGGVAGGEWLDLGGMSSDRSGQSPKWVIGVSAFSTVSSVTLDLYFAKL